MLSLPPEAFARLEPTKPEGRAGHRGEAGFATTLRAQLGPARPRTEVDRTAEEADGVRRRGTARLRKDDGSVLELRAGGILESEQDMVRRRASFTISHEKSMQLGARLPEPHRGATSKTP